MEYVKRDETEDLLTVLGGMSPQTFLDDYSDEESELRVRKKLRTDGIKHVECDCRHYTQDSIMLECSKCGKSWSLLRDTYSTCVGSRA